MSTASVRVVLVGPPGAGKTTVGGLLATRWGARLCDTDALIEAEQGCTVSDIFVERGEPVFRALEETAVATALVSGDAVIALGGGAVLSEQTRSTLQGLPVAFLDVGLADAADRVGLGVTRPLLLGNVRAQMKAMLDARRPLYREVATFVVGTDGRTPDQVADAIERGLAS